MPSIFEIGQAIRTLSDDHERRDARHSELSATKTP
jgi:hypothetical protein